MKKDTSYLSFVETFQFSKNTSPVKGIQGYLFVVSSTAVRDKLIKQRSLSWQQSDLLSQEKELTYFISDLGPVWILNKKSKVEGDYAWYRDQVGSLVAHFRAHKVDALQVEMQGILNSAQLGVFVGFDLAAYDFKSASLKKLPAGLPKVYVLGKVSAVIVQEAIIRASAINNARHLVNVPPNDLNPGSFAKAVSDKFKGQSSVSVEVWDPVRLKKENMNLHLAVGQGAESGSHLVHIKYRPNKAKTLKKLKKTMAFVGKGITFDTGGLDLKPSSAMRLMKKDMGGAAAVFGLAAWVVDTKYPQPLDFYLALAENSVDSKSMRPSDIYTSRRGYTVEIDNTDAEGRLVLADALDVAITQNEDLAAVIDVATLTGAIKVGLGAEIAGLFSNDEKLSAKIHQAGKVAGDPNWIMPLHQKYFSDLSSPFADFKNSGGSFGGAITAALFLEKFVRNKPWAHLDIYAWSDKAQGALSSSGGSGQAVQCLIEFLNKSK